MAIDIPETKSKNSTMNSIEDIPSLSVQESLPFEESVTPPDTADFLYCKVDDKVNNFELCTLDGFKEEHLAGSGALGKMDGYDMKTTFTLNANMFADNVEGGNIDQLQMETDAMEDVSDMIIIKNNNLDKDDDGKSKSFGGYCMTLAILDAEDENQNDAENVSDGAEDISDTDCEYHSDEDAESEDSSFSESMSIIVYNETITEDISVTDDQRPIYQNVNRSRHRHSKYASGFSSTLSNCIK